MNKRVLELARDMASYGHHSGYPRYDGGHSEPEEQCQHPDCVAVRDAASAPPLSPDKLEQQVKDLRLELSYLMHREYDDNAAACYDNRRHLAKVIAKQLDLTDAEREEMRLAGTEHGSMGADIIRWLVAKLRAEVAQLKASPASPPRAWHPIETAPKQAKMIIVAARTIRSEPLQTMFAYWNQQHEGWYRLYAHEATRIYPTHWMPLPDPPGVTRADKP